jgi:hypothetical protein
MAVPRLASIPAPYVHTELDPRTQISGFQEIETDELRPDLGCRPISASYRVKVGQIGTRLSAVMLAPIFMRAVSGGFDSVPAQATLVTRGLDPRVHLLRIKPLRRARMVA